MRRVGSSGVALLLVLAVLLPANPAVAAPGPSAAPEWWFDRWGVPALWAQGADGRGVTIAEIDSGVNTAVPELAGKILAGTDYGPHGGDGGTDHELDPFGHGTAMASIMVAAPGTAGIQGMAPAARILPIAVPLEGTDDATSNDHLSDAIRYAADHGAKIINMSLGASRDPALDSAPCPPAEQSAVDYAATRGDLVLAAAGNGGTSGSPVEEPAVCVGVITVGAVDSSQVVPSFSSRHPYVTVVAPGVNIPSLGRLPGTAYQGDGTSQATAIASAALAMIWSRFPALTNSQVLARLLATLDVPHPSRDPEYGYGVINPARAIQTEVPADTPEPILSALAPYLALDRAIAAASSPAPPTARRSGTPPGAFVVGTPPSRFTAAVWTSGAVALVALLALLALGVFGWRRARTARELRAVASAPSTPSPTAWLPEPDWPLRAAGPADD